jgi:hypothetical protein
VKIQRGNSSASSDRKRWASPPPATKAVNMWERLWGYGWNTIASSRWGIRVSGESRYMDHKTIKEKLSLP